MRLISRLLVTALAITFLAAAPVSISAYIKPIDRDTTPSLAEVYEDYFLLGNIYEDMIKDSSIPRHYNVITGGNLMKPDALSSGGSGASGTFNRWTSADNLMNYAMTNGKKVHGHVLVWHGQSPAWLNGGSGSGAGTYTRARAKANMELYISTVVQHFDDPKWNGTLISWDVVNEAFIDELASIPDGAYWRDYLRLGNQSGWYRAYVNGMDAEAGEKPGDFIYDAFVFARKYTDAKLFYNDFNMYQDGKSKLVAQMVIELNAQYRAEHPDDPRQLIDGVGLQSHNYIQDTPASSVENGILNLLAAGVDLSISELDLFCFYPYNAEPSGGFVRLDQRTAAQLVGSNGTQEQRYYWANLGVTTGAEVEKIQAKLYAEYFSLYKKYAEHIDRVTFWGIRDSESWRSRHNPLIFNSDYSPKEAFWAVADPEGYLAADKRELEALLNSISTLDERLYTAESWSGLTEAAAIAEGILNDDSVNQEEVDQAVRELKDALGGLTEASLTCTVKSMLAKVAKLQKIPYTWNGYVDVAGVITFSSSNTAVCNVTADGTLVPMKAGIAVITIAVPNKANIIFAVTVSA